MTLYVLKVDLVNNHDFLASAESAYRENATPNQASCSLQVNMVSEDVATRLRGSEKTVT